MNDVRYEEDHFGELAELLRGMRVVVLTGAGCSTESGIPDYRGPETGKKPRNPIMYREFVDEPETRTRYWARAAVGWEKFSGAAPNDAHRAIARMEEEGIVEGVITQNVDRLHHRAGSRRVVELHGALAEVRCLDCGDIEPRRALQRRLFELNPAWREMPAEMAPDGDAEVPASATRDFTVPSCLACDGVMKPNVVFFGENVPKPVVDEAWNLFMDAEVLLVVGSSLTVFSGYRFVRKAAKKRLPVGIVNIGPTRGDDEAWVKVDGRAGDIMPRLADLLCS